MTRGDNVSLYEQNHLLVQEENGESGDLGESLSRCMLPVPAV